MALLIFIILIALWVLFIHVKVSNFETKLKSVLNNVTKTDKVNESTLNDNLVLNQLNNLTTQFITILTILVAVSGFVSYKTFSEQIDQINSDYINIKEENTKLKQDIISSTDQKILLNEYLFLSEMAKFNHFIKNDFFNTSTKKFEIEKLRYHTFSFPVITDYRNYILQKNKLPSPNSDLKNISLEHTEDFIIAINTLTKIVKENKTYLTDSNKTTLTKIFLGIQALNNQDKKITEVINSFIIELNKTI